MKNRVRTFVWVMVVIMALVAYLTHQQRQLANNVYLTEDGVVLEYLHKAPVHVPYADIDKVMFYCEGRRGGCGVNIYTKNGKTHQTLNHQESESARALRQQITKHIQSN